VESYTVTTFGIVPRSHADSSTSSDKAILETRVIRARQREHLRDDEVSYTIIQCTDVEQQFKQK